MDGAIRTQLAESPDAVRRAGILEESHELVAEPGGREVADEPHLDAAPEKASRVLVEAEPVPRLVADAAEDPRRVVDERQVVQHAQQACLQVGAAAERIDEASEVVRGERRGHRVDREVAPEEVLAQARPLDGRERTGRIVELGPGRDDVDALAVAVRHDRRPELPVRRRATPEGSRKCVRELDRVALDGDVDVEALLAEEDVPNRPAHEVDAVGAIRESTDRLEHCRQPRRRAKLAGDARGGLCRRRRRSLELAEQVRPADDSDERVVAEHRDATVIG